MANEANEVLLEKSGLVRQAAVIKNHEKCTEKNCNLRTLNREYDCLAEIGTKEAFTLLLEN